MLINPLFFILINNPKIFLKISPFLKQILKILIKLQMPQDNECVDMNLIHQKEGHVVVADNAKDATRHFVQGVDMEIHYLMKRNMIIFQNFKIN